ncbi:hypothetical protein HRbin02_00763 [Candidatus Calditenuaceae archaeon HR02]|nr:hypothetical protein HRbin02_00763 [Candidatus Calditenuaceae archaeon HR02]
MEANQRVYHVTSGAQDLERILLSDDTASRANIVLKDAKLLLGREGYYIRIVGTEEQLRRVDELLREKARLVVGEELGQVIAKMREEDERALSGFGGIFTE